MTSLCTILVNRLVLHLREQSAEQLPTTIETEGKFQAALPVTPPQQSMTCVGNPSFIKQYFDGDNDSDT